MSENIVINNQPVLSKILNYINNNKINNGSYLLVGENASEIKKYSILLSKIFACPNKYSNNCNKCNICKRIDTNNYTEIKVISPENNIIKKESIIEVRDYYNTKSVEGSSNIYIINDIDTLNVAAANSLLKFLEEPDGNVVAIFNTTNLNKVLPTIISRCQIIKVNNIKKNNGISFIEEVTNLTEEEIYDILSYIKKIEFDRALAFANIKTEIITKFDTKEKIASAIEVILLFYKDVLNYKIKNKSIYFEENDIKRVAQENSSDVIIKKISFILENISKIEYNVNILLFMSNLIIGIGDVANDKSSRY